jgi:hypothetical protein
MEYYSRYRMETKHDRGNKSDRYQLFFWIKKEYQTYK